MTGPDVTATTTLSEKLALVTHHHLLTRVPVKLDGTTPSKPPPLTPEELKVDKIALSWIFLTLSDALQKRLVIARPKSAKEAWDFISDLVKNNKRSRTSAFKMELQSIKLGDLSMEAYFQKVDTLMTILVSLDSPVSDEDMVHYVLDGLPEKYSQDFLTRRVLLRCDSTGDLYPVTAPSHIPHAFLGSLYGLKQAPRAWFQRFASYITRVGFHHSRCDSSLFIYRQETDTAYLLLHVDDIVLNTSYKTLLQQVIGWLHQDFSMTGLGSLNYFLGIFVTRDSSGMFLSQKKYTVEIPKRAGMVNCNPSRTSVDTESKLGDTGDIVSDPTLYRSLAGSLQYLTFTRPYISYPVQQVCLYMHDPREPHLSALKRILRHVRSTLEYGLQLFSSSTTDLVAYSDADWAGCLTTRCSTSGEVSGVVNAVAETCWTRNLLRELHFSLSSATLVYCDNVSAVYLSCNPVQHQCTKHIEIDINFVRDLVAAGQKRKKQISTKTTLELYLSGVHSLRAGVVASWLQPKPFSRQ
nr:ribonuclease H-like domain-containing protein [Tanacetum cinerariifolium]